MADFFALLNLTTSDRSRIYQAELPNGLAEQVADATRLAVDHGFAVVATGDRNVVLTRPSEDSSSVHTALWLVSEEHGTPRAYIAIALRSKQGARAWKSLLELVPDAAAAGAGTTQRPRAPWIAVALARAPISAPTIGDDIIDLAGALAWTAYDTQTGSPENGARNA